MADESTKLLVCHQFHVCDSQFTHPIEQVRVSWVKVINEACRMIDFEIYNHELLQWNCLTFSLLLNQKSFDDGISIQKNDKLIIFLKNSAFKYNHFRFCSQHLVKYNRR